MIFYRSFFYLLLIVLCWVGSLSVSAKEMSITIYETVEQALDYNPEIKALHHNYKAAEYDLKQSRGAYLPSIDIMLQYGLEEHNDYITREPDADPDENDWDPRGNATLKMTQNIYEGGKTSKQISINKALLDVAHLNLLDKTQTIALNAIIVHLDVYRQRRLLALAENNLKIHNDIYESLAEGEKAGAISIADVTQIQARVASAQSTLYRIKSDLNRAIAQYSRVVGCKPGELAYTEVPKIIMPSSLEKALKWMEEKNPELLAYNAMLIEAIARVGLRRSNYKPELDIEVSSRYDYQLEGDTSWQLVNEGMLVFRWNLFNGGQDKAGHYATMERKNHILSIRNAKLTELQEAVSSAWADSLSLKMQKESFRKAADYSQKTFNAYLKHFFVAKRDLLDVLSVANDFFQSASGLITVSVDEVITAYSILRLAGELRVLNIAQIGESSDENNRFLQRLDLSGDSN